MLKRKRTRRLPLLGWSTVVLLGVAILLPLLLIISVTTSTRTVAQAGGEHVEGIVGSPLYINPLLASFNEADKDLASLVFSGLTRINGKGEAAPDLARDWTISPDGLDYTFWLRSGITWHDGARFTSEDVLFTIQTIQKSDFPGSPDLANAWKGVKIEKLDDLTVRFTLPEPSGPFLAQTALGIVPASILAKVPVSDLTKSPFNLNPVGTGPYKVQEATAQAVVLDANPVYHLSAPFLSRITFLFFPTQEALVKALKEKKVAGATLRSPSPADLSAFEKDPALKLYRAPRFSYELVFLNLKDPLFTDRDVRQALAYATDRLKITQNEAEGQGIVADTPILPGTWAYDNGARKYDYSPDRARSLLDGAGWKPGPDGVREKGGNRLKFALFTDTSPRRIKIAEELSREWEKVGIKAEVATSGASGLVQNFLLPRRYQAALLGIVLGPDPDPYPLWHSSQKEGAGYNFSSFSDPKIDDLLAQARKSHDQVERAKLYAEFQKAFAEQEPSILLYYPYLYYVLNKDLKGVEVGNFFEGSDRFRTITQWYVKTKTVEAKGSLLDRVLALAKDLARR
ncbi:MAG: ABC transporter substrate-binding protein [Dehalococcoidia bacterium]|nr:ABC transporter substrate-binding protein [Dehalococcoidia bacterium]